MKELVHTKQAPAAIGPYSQAVKVRGISSMLFVSGQIALVPETGRMVTGGVAAETTQVLENARSVVEAAGFTMNDVVKATIYLVDMGDFSAVNEVYASFFSESLPARATIAVARLPKDARVEIAVTCAA